MLAIEQYDIEYTYRQEKGEKLLKFLAFFLDKHCFCVHRSYFDFVDMPSLCSARYIRVLRNIFHKTANSICFRYTQTRYDINPRSRSEHFELLMAHSCHRQYIERGTRISKIRISGFISMRTCSMAGTLQGSPFSSMHKNGF